jgi:hypothetical protein
MGGHSTTSPDGKWTIEIFDGTENEMEILKLEIHRGNKQDSSFEDQPLGSFKTLLPGFDARASATKESWSENGKVCNLQLATFSEIAFLVVTPSESRVEYDPLLALGVTRLIDPLPWFFFAVVFLLLYRFLDFRASKK